MPKRLFKDPFTKGPAKGVLLSQKEFQKSLKEYYQIRGWDENGIPTKERIGKLGLDKYGKGII